MPHRRATVGFLTVLLVVGVLVSFRTLRPTVPGESFLAQASNQPPTVTTPLPQMFTLPSSTTSLAVGVADDGLPTPLPPSTNWSAVSGPGAVTFSESTARKTTATFSTYGTYVLRLTANDGTLSASADVQVTIGPPASSQASSSQASVSDTLLLTATSSEPPPSPKCDACAECGSGVLNICDEEECRSLGSCLFTPALLGGGTCSADPLLCGEGASSAQGSSQESSAGDDRESGKVPSPPPPADSSSSEDYYSDGTGGAPPPPIPEGANGGFTEGGTHVYTDEDFDNLVLQEGMTVYIHAKESGEPYRRKIAITKSNISIIGVVNSAGQLPEITSDGATISSNMDFPHGYNDEKLATIWISHPSTSSGQAPKNILLKGLKITGAHEDKTFINSLGEVGYHPQNASGIWIGAGEDIRVEGCEIAYNGNGAMDAPANDPYDPLHLRWIKRLQFVGNYFYDNGVSGSSREHHLYTEALGDADHPSVVVEYNHFGPMLAGSDGHQLKDRSLYTVVRYNKFDGTTNNCMDLVEAEATSALFEPEAPFADHPRQTLVYGNEFSRQEADRAYGSLIHFGEDNNDPRTRFDMQFYNNTVYVKADASSSTKLILFRIEKLTDEDPNGYEVDAFNNIVYVDSAGGPTDVYLMEKYGILDLGVNAFSPSTYWKQFNAAASGIVNGLAILLSFAENASPFVNKDGGDLHLVGGTVAIDTGQDAEGVDREYVYEQLSKERATVGPIDMGAYEYEGS